MLSNCNNLLAIKTFHVETDEWESTETDLSIFNLVRGTVKFAKMQSFVDTAEQGSQMVISRMKITCNVIDQKAIQINIVSKKAEIDNLRKMIKSESHQWQMPDGTIMSNKFGNSNHE